MAGQAGLYEGEIVVGEGAGDLLAVHKMADAERFELVGFHIAKAGFGAEGTYQEGGGESREEDEREANDGGYGDHRSISERRPLSWRNWKFMAGTISR